MPTSSSTPLRWGILSTARINDEVIPAFGSIDMASLDAVASRDLDRARRYADSRGIPRFYGSYDELISDPELDCIYISVPNAMHAQWTKKALEAGKHVLCEKPLTPTAEEAKRLFETAKRHDRVLMEAFMYRHHPQTRLARQLLLGGAVGQLQVMRLSFNFKTSDPSTDVRYSSDMSGGALLDVGSYCVNFCTYVMGAAPTVVGGMARNTRSGVEEGFVGQMRFDGDVLAVFDVSLYTTLDIGITAVGTEGKLCVPTPWYPHKPPQQIHVERGDERWIEDCPGDNAYKLEIANLCAAVRGHEEPLISENETLRNLLTLERLAVSAGLGLPADDKEGKT